jgi:ferritin-like metal-binding protein YciE
MSGTPRHPQFRKEEQMPVSDPKDLFVHELKDVLFAERTIEKALPKLAREATDAGLKADIEHHLEETRQQIANLEEVFANLDMAARGQKCPGIEGLMKEHDEFMSENKKAPAMVVDAFLCGAASRTEHYEIAAYTGLVSAARAMGKSDIARLLQENLAQEQAMLEKATSAHERIVSAPVKA